VTRNLIAQIETHKKRGSVTTLDRLARALSIPIETLIAEHADADSAEISTVGRT
jgi:transcriptional regulator with XRE-family HTH domain